MFNFYKKTDSQIQQDVLNEIMWDPSVSSTQINVATKDGIVTLSGSVPHYFEKSQAEEAAQRVGGVRAVADEIAVDIMGSYKRTDEQIAQSALSALEWSYSIPKDLKVTVEKGWITLKGEVEWNYQRIAAKNAVSHLLGVCGVTNKIAIKAKPQGSDIKSRIESALKRSAESEGRSIHVEVKGDKVILTGSLHSFSEIEEVRLAAWMAPGVVTVENNLKLAH